MWLVLGSVLGVEKFINVLVYRSLYSFLDYLNSNPAIVLMHHFCSQNHISSGVGIVSDNLCKSKLDGKLIYFERRFNTYCIERLYEDIDAMLEHVKTLIRTFASNKWSTKSVLIMPMTMIIGAVAKFIICEMVHGRQ